MLIHLSEILSKEGKVVEKQVELELEFFNVQFGSFPILKKKPVSVRIENTGKQVLLIGIKTELTIAIPCDRCLKDVMTEFSLDSSKELDMKLTEEEKINELDENNYITGYDLDVDRLVHGEILVNWPMKILCDENCKGICKKCGNNRNQGDCGCDTTELDPRMAAIRDIFEQFKEV